jgi:hypothetical protein
VEGIVRDGWEKADVLEGALHEFWPVGQGAGEHAAVDEVEGLGKVPVFFKVFHVEGEVWWDASRRGPVSW